LTACRTDSILRILQRYVPFPKSLSVGPVPADASKELDMPGDVYTHLREQLDQYSVGFPATASGVEMKILEKLFTEEEAGMYLNLSMMLDTPQAVAERTGMDPEEVSRLLERMAEKGLVFRLRKESSAKYAAVPFVIGFYEFQVASMDRELAELIEHYFQEAFERQTAQQVVPLRTIPVNRAMDVSWPVAPYEDLREIIRRKDKIAVANCICRVQQGRLEQACDKPLEVCLSFGSHAGYYVDRGMGRWIGQEEALQILDQCERAGLVPQPLNTQDPGGMCNCCGDCCGMLRSLKKHPRPAEMVVTNYFASVDEDLCVGCETCLDRCQMDAITTDEGVAKVNRERCIGCGLCVTTCSTEALRLERIPDHLRREPPTKAQEMMMQMALKRGKSLIPLSYLKASQTKA
jgi:electron transport complex protein RnfB